jgi:Protein of unknown function (DUF3224)
MSDSQGPIKGLLANATFEVTSWDEQPFDESEGLGKLTVADVTKTYGGDIDGASVTRWLMAYAEDGSATFVGLERISGSVAGRKGTLTLQHVGAFVDGAARATLKVLPGGGTEALAEVSGEGDFLADPAGSVKLRLTFPT